MNKQDDLADRIYRYLKEQWEQKQQMPTQREMASACESSLSTVNEALSILEAQGRIVRQRYKKQGIRFVEGEPEVDEQVQSVYEYICDAIASGANPTQTEIARELYLTRREVRRCITVLETLGHIEQVVGNWGYKLAS